MLPRSPGRCCRLENMDLYCGVAISKGVENSGSTFLVCCLVPLILNPSKIFKHDIITPGLL